MPRGLALVIIRLLQIITGAKTGLKTFTWTLFLQYALQFCTMNRLSSLSRLRRTEIDTRLISIARACHATQQRSFARRKSTCHGEKSTKSKLPSQSLSPLHLPFWTCRSTWNRAGINTLRCLIGCTAGDFSAMWLLQSYYSELGTSSIMVASSELSFPRKSYDQS